MTIWFLFLLHAPERKKKKVLKRVFFSKNKNQRHHHSPHYQITIIHIKSASRKSFSVTVFLLARIAYIPASVQTLLISAPGENQKVSKSKKPISINYPMFNRGS